MKIFYTCEYCGKPIDTVEVAAVDEVKFGFDCLTEQERQDIIKTDITQNAMYVKSVCDGCIIAMGVEDNAIPLGMPAVHKGYLH